MKTDNIIVFQVVIWPVQLNPVNENPHLGGTAEFGKNRTLS